LYTKLDDKACRIFLIYFLFEDNKVAILSSLVNQKMAMSSLPRKTGSNSIGARVVPSAASVAAAKSGGGGASLPSSQYLDALNILCEATMNEACALALSEKDYDETKGSSSNGSIDNINADYKRLLELETSCRDAAKVLQEQAVTIVAPAALPPPPCIMPASLPGSRLPIGGVSKTMMMGTTAPKALMVGAIGKSIGAPVMAKANLLMRRGSLQAAVGRPGKRRQDTMEDGNKKARLTGSSAGDCNNNNNNKTTSDAPPPNALNFLKMLNQDKSITITAASSTTSITSTTSTTPLLGEEKNTTTTKQSTTTSKKEKATKETDKKDSDQQPSVSITEQGQDEHFDSDHASEGVSDHKQTSPPGGSKPVVREGTRKNPARGARK
jgi:hypothetical protein